MRGMQKLDLEDDVWSVKRFSERSFDDEFGSTIEGDLLLLQVPNSNPLNVNMA